MSEIGNDAFLASPVAVGVVAIALLAAGVLTGDPKVKRAALSAAGLLAVPIGVIVAAAVAIFITLMAHQAHCPGLLFHSVAAFLGVSALVTAIAMPLIGWRWGMAG